MLLTRLPLSIATSFDLHVLGVPPTFNLSHDQTLQFNIFDFQSDPICLLRDAFFPTMMPSNHLLKTNYVFPHEWLVCTFCFLPAFAFSLEIACRKNHNALALYC